MATMEFQELREKLDSQDEQDETERREYIEEELIKAEDALEVVLMFSQDEDIRREIIGAYRNVLYTRFRHYIMENEQ